MAAVGQLDDVLLSSVAARAAHLWLLVVVVLLGVGGLARASSSQAPPNILFAIADDWGHGHAGAYGCRWVRTPAFDRVAQQGLLFHHAYTPNAKCAPSRACILTGRNPWQLGPAANHVPFFPPTLKTFPEVLRERGWWVGHTAKGWGPGIATNAQGQARAMTGQAFNRRSLTPPTTGIAANDYAANFADFLDAAPAGRPWFFWYGALEPHRSYEPGSGVARGGKRLSDVDRVPGYWPDTATVRGDMLDYALEVEHFDAHLGRMLDELERRDLRANTLVIVTSDHGMPFPRVKGQAYLASNRVPLAMMWPAGIPGPGREIAQPVSFIDFAPTMLEFAGLTAADCGMDPFAGASLLPLLAGVSPEAGARWRDHILIGKERHDVGRPGDAGYPIRGILQDGMLYLRNHAPDRWPAGNPETGYLNCDAGATKTEVLEARRRAGANRYWSLCFGRRPEEELYDVRRDPDCVQNLATDAAYATRRRQLEQRMVTELRAQEDPRMAGQGHVFDEYPYAAAEHRGFYERFLRGEDLKAGWISPADVEREPIPDPHP